MRKRIVFTIGMLFNAQLLSAQGTPAATAEATEKPEVRTTGTAERSIRPDRATFTVSFSALGASPKEAGSRVAARADSLRRAYGALGIPRDSLVSGSQWYWWRGRIEIVPQPVQYLRRAQPSATGQMQDVIQDTLFRARDAIEVRTHDLSRVGALIDVALAQGLLDISPVRYSGKPDVTVQNELLTEATRRARAQAETIANASGSSLGAVKALSTSADGESRYYGGSLGGLSVTAGLSDAGENPTVAIAPAVHVSVTVYGRWTLVPKP
jgi:uncharacterized protein